MPESIRIIIAVIDIFLIIYFSYRNYVISKENDMLIDLIEEMIRSLKECVEEYEDDLK